MIFRNIKTILIYQLKKSSYSIKFQATKISKSHGLYELFFIGHKTLYLYDKFRIKGLTTDKELLVDYCKISCFNAFKIKKHKFDIYIKHF